MPSLSSIALAVSLIHVSIQSTPPSFTDVLSAQQNLSSFQGLLTSQIPGLLKQIQASTSPLTILAPSNSAFDKIPYYPVIGPAWAAQDFSAIQDIMSYHVLPGTHSTDTMNSTFEYYETWLTNATFANVTGGQRVGGVVQAGYMPQMVWTSGFSSRSIVTNEDIAFDGGTIQIIDSLVIPPTSFPDTAERFSLAIELYGLDSFLGAFYSTPNATLANLLNTTSDITVLAPNNVGMESVTTTLTSLSNTSLTDLLSYHVILNPNGPLFSTNFTNGTTLQTLQGGSVTLTFASNSWFVNSARILTSDLLLANGVMHVLDNVLDPNITSIQPNPTSATQPPVLQTTTAADFNSSMAPFTTYLPNEVMTADVVQNGGAVTVSGYVGSISLTGVSAVPTETAPGYLSTSGAGHAGTGMGGVVAVVACVLGVFAGALFL